MELVNARANVYYYELFLFFFIYIYKWMKERLGLKVSRETLFSAAAGPALSLTRERSSFQASSQDR